MISRAKDDKCLREFGAMRANDDELAEVYVVQDVETGAPDSAMWTCTFDGFTLMSYQTFTNGGIGGRVKHFTPIVEKVKRTFFMNQRFVDKHPDLASIAKTAINKSFKAKLMEPNAQSSFIVKAREATKGKQGAAWICFCKRREWKAFNGVIRKLTTTTAVSELAVVDQFFSDHGPLWQVIVAVCSRNCN